jgi:hypothetical protein
MLPFGDTCIKKVRTFIERREMTKMVRKLCLLVNAYT